MGKNVTIYLDDEALQLYEQSEKGILINRLLKDYFSNSEEVLNERFLIADRERNVAKARLDEKINQRLRKEQEASKKKMLTKEQEERRLEVEEMKRKWQNDEITDEEYWDFFDNRKV